MSEQLHDASKEPLPWWVKVCRRLWKVVTFLGTAVLASLVVNVVSTWLTSSKGIIPSDAPVIGLLTQWPLALSIGCCLLLLAFAIWMLSRENPSRTALPLPTAQDREHMVQRLRLRYEQMLAQSLQGVVQLELGLASRPAAVHNAASLSLRLPDQPEQLLPAHTSIVQAYEQAQHELLILGEPGAGKSTFLLELAHHLVGQAEQNATQPLPILLPLSSWANNHRPLQDWLMEHVALLYDVPRKLSQQWVQTDLILPLLDGLDEMDEAARAACIAAINAYHHEHLRPLVVCSRTNEYTAATRQERLALHTAVIVQPLSIQQVDTHLECLGKPLAALRSALKKNVTLQELATTPLMLQVLMLTYYRTRVRELSHKEVRLRQEIWSDYIQQMVTRKGDARRYPLHVTTIWLSFLARQMRAHNQTIFILEQLQPDWLPKEQRTLYQWNTVLVFGLLTGLVLGLVGWLLGWLLGALLTGLLTGLVLGLLTGLVFGLLAGNVKIEPTEVLAWSWKSLRSGLFTRLSPGLLIGLAFGLGVGVVSRPFFGLLTGLVLGLLTELLTKLERKQLAERQAFSPNEGIRRSIKNGLIAGLVFGLVGGLVLGLVDGLLTGVVFGLIFGLLLGLILGLGAAVRHYTLRFWLRRTYTFPWKAVPFLEDATARILLRRVGGGYSFTHRLLLDHFADLDTVPPSPSTGGYPVQQPPLP